MIAEASGHTAAATHLLGRIQTAILFPLMSLLVAVAILVFLWGAYEYVYNSDSEMARETGRRHMLYGIIGLLVMLSAFAILRIAIETFGIGLPS
jgi:TRAP-type C4-dicarboxylate transport system permease small subunit